MRFKEKIAWFLAMGGLLFFHFYRLQLHTLNFPNWGDDYAFLELLDYVQKHDWKENVNYIFHFHNNIHRIAYSRIWILIQYALLGHLNFKTAIILANVQLVLILIPFHWFLQKIKRSPWHLVGIAALLLAPFGNIDNFNLIGVLQHTGSILFLVWIAYGLFYAENQVWFIILALFYPFVSTEGLAFLPMVGYVLWTKKSHLKIPFTVFALAVIVFYFHDYVGSASSTGQVTWSLFKGLFIFLGNWALPISDSFRASINFLAGIPVVLFFTWKILGSFRINITFPSLLFLQIAATGLLICYGRSGMGDLELIALSDRFLLYGNTMLMAIYCALIFHKHQTLRLPWALLLSGTWMIASFFMARRPLQEMYQRWTADLLGAYYFQSSSAYECPPETMQLLKKTYYRFDTEEIPRQFPKFSVQKTSPIHPTINRFQEGRLSLSWNQIPEKTNVTDQRFVVLAQENTPEKKYYITSLSNDYTDRTKHSKLLIFNTLPMAHFQVFLLNLPNNQYPTYQYLSALTITNQGQLLR